MTVISWVSSFNNWTAGTIALRNIPSYTYVDIGDRFIEDIVLGLKVKYQQEITQCIGLADAIDSNCVLRMWQVERPAKTSRAAPPPCSCGHGEKVGRHKNGCTRAKAKKIE
jgi:hypothetical protein